MQDMNLFGTVPNLIEDGMSLQYVRNQTPAICLAAVKQDALALEFVKDVTPEIYSAAEIRR